MHRYHALNNSFSNKLPVSLTMSSMMHRQVRLIIPLLAGLISLTIYLSFRKDFLLPLRVSGPGRWTLASHTPDTPSTPDSTIFQNGTLGFGKIFVLSLPSRTDKRDALTLAAAVTDLQLTFRDGPKADDIHDKATPPIHFHEQGIFTKDGEVGCWRGHMNILSEIISNNIQTALIIEDDVDWDVNIASQAEHLATATRDLTSRLPENNLDTTTSPKISLRKSLPETTTNPYGPDWDILHVGHCNGIAPDDEWTPYHALIPHDATVPPPWAINDMIIGQDERETCIGHPTRIAKDYNCTRHVLEPDTRILQYRAGPQCTFGYAVTQQGAKKMLARLGGLSPEDLTTAIDIQMREMCRRGVYGGKGREDLTCLTLSPPIILKHHPKGSLSLDSDINKVGGGEDGEEEFRDIGQTDGAVWSARLNVEAMLAGKDPQTQYVYDADLNLTRYREADEYEVI